MTEQEQSTPAWELCKENAAPLARGRNVKKLEESFCQKKSSISEEQAQRDMAHYEALLVQESNDPLIHWMRYIKYHQETFPSDTNAQFLLMERCVRTLVENEQYRNDLRFIRVCSTYADKTSSPADIFKYMHQRKIGTKVALFWVAWAYVAEKKQDYSFAEKVFTKGLSNNAEPIKFLQARHKQFQRRMSRHWLNESSQRDEEEEEESGSGRAALGGLTETRIKRNDRRQRSARQERSNPSSRSSSQRTFTDRNASRPPASSTNNGVPAAGGFQIFTDDNAADENDEFLQHQHDDVHRRELETEAARKKENTRDTERWNERGGYSSRVAGATARRSTRTILPAAPSFDVHVDPECESQHKKEREKVQSQFDKGGRALQKREREDVSEKLARDPMRYISNPEKLAKDTKKAEEEKNKASKKKGASLGFDRKLVDSKDENGQPCCFEEHRAIGRHYKLVDPSLNVNLLQKAEECADEDSVEDVEMEESIDEVEMDAGGSIVSKASSQEEARRVLFSLNVSFDHEKKSYILNASTASSTFDGGIGNAASREEETINTKFAMKELSMMFSSPALGLGGEGSSSAAKKRPRLLNDSYSVVLDDDDAGCGLNNSIIASDEQEKPNFKIFSDENAPPKKIGFEIFSEEEPPAASKGIQIFNDGSSKPKSGFQIFSDEPSPVQPVEKKRGFEIFKEEHKSQADSPAKPSTERAPFSTRRDRDGKSEDDSAAHDDGGDTATLSLFGDAMDALNELSQSITGEASISPKKKDFQIFSEADESTKSANVSKAGGQFSIRADTDHGGESDEEGGDTATLSLFGDAMDMLNDMKEPRPTRPSPLVLKDQNTSMDDFRKYRPRDSGAILTDGAGFGDISLIESNIPLSPTLDSTETLAVSEKIDYVSLHKDDIKSSLRQLSQQASHAGNGVPFSGPETDLALMLSKKGTIVDLPTHAMPRALKRKASKQGEEIKVGSRMGVIKRELGRGSYGVVVLMDSATEGTLAVKAQCPSDCLAWEFVLMQRLVERTERHVSNPIFPFPKALSFAALADGALLGMTAGSNTGMNLVDLSNVYKVREGGQVPELIAIHYVTRMLKHIEMLHWHGKILHCDVKPDNWVMVDSDSSFGSCTETIPASELMLVDFGRAIDLTTAGKDGADPLGVKLSGFATVEDMACAAMRRNLGWSFDLDTFGICASAHVLLYGSHIEIDIDRSSKRWVLRKPFRRYHQKELWGELFETLLNLDDITQTAIGSRPRSLRQLRGKLEDHVQARVAELESLLKHQARILPKKRPS